MPNKVEAYACKFCNKILQSKSAATNHENNTCKFSNIAARCDSCKYLTFIVTDKTHLACEKRPDVFYHSGDIEFKNWQKHCPDWSTRDFTDYELRKYKYANRKTII